MGTRGTETFVLAQAGSMRDLLRTGEQRVRARVRVERGVAGVKRSPQARSLPGPPDCIERPECREASASRPSKRD